MQISKGIYTVVYASGAHRTLRVKEVKQGRLAGRTVVGFMIGSTNTEYQNFGFLEEGRLSFWRRFREENDAVRLQRIERALQIISADPSEAGRAYALKSGKCFKCNRLLTNPASIQSGIGPECARQTAG